MESTTEPQLAPERPYQKGVDIDVDMAFSLVDVLKQNLYSLNQAKRYKYRNVEVIAGVVFTRDELIEILEDKVKRALEFLNMEIPARK